MLRAFGRSDPGPVRRVNEDSFASEEDLSLFVVADGVGGHSAGDVASRLAIETVVGFIRRSQDTSDFTWPHGVDPALSRDANRLRTAIQLANNRLVRTSETRAELQGMGTTVVSALISGSRLVIAHVGDSRLYSLVGGLLRRLTRDDSWSERLGASENGAERSRADAESMKHALTNALGVQAQTPIAVDERDLVDGEMLLFCSDGLHGVVDDATLHRLMSADADLPTMANRLVDTALASATRDNVTALLVRYQRECRGRA